MEGIGTGDGCGDEELGDGMALSGTQTQVLEVLQGTMNAYFPQYGDEGARAVMVDAFEQADQEFGEGVAKEWAGNFAVPEEVVADHVTRFELAGRSIERMAAGMREEHRASRLNVERVQATLSVDNPEWDRVMEFAGPGVELLLPPAFLPSGVEGRPEIRQKQRDTGQAVTKMMVEGYVQTGLAIVLPLSSIKEAKEEVGILATSWAKNPGKPSGRTVVDANDGGQGTGINGDEVCEAANTKWRRIENPTLAMIMLMILSFWDVASTLNPHRQWSDLRIWKMDLRGAFTLLDFNPRWVPLLGTELGCGLFIFYLVGLFGWSAMPMAFNVITRAIVWELRQPGVLRGSMDMFVDDMFGVCWAEDLEHDMNKAEALCRRLLGERAIAEHKSESGVRLTLLGWDIDLTKMLVTIARKNALRAFFGYAHRDLSGFISVRVAQAYASWAERYGEVCVWMRPWRRVLYDVIRGRGGRGDKRKMVKVSSMARRVVRLYQALLALTLHREGVFARSFSSFRIRSTPTLMITFDGCLDGIGIVWHSVAGTWDAGRRRFSAQTVLGAAALCLRSMNFGGDTSFQNLAEYIGWLVGILVPVLKGWDTSAVVTVGDSATALAWGMSGRFRSNNVINAATVCAVLRGQNEINVVGYHQITSLQNRVTDVLSRRRAEESWDNLTQRLGWRDLHNMGVSEELEGFEEIRLRDWEEFLELCNPSRVYEGEQEFGMFWGSVCSFIENMSLESNL